MKSTLFILLFSSIISVNAFSQESNTHFKLTDNKLDTGTILITYSIYFGLDSAYIRETTKPYLDSIVNFMLKHDSVELAINVFADYRISKAYSENLMQNRADSIMGYLISKGIDKSRLSAYGYMQGHYLLPNATTEDEHQKNRRVELKIVGIRKD